MRAGERAGRVLRERGGPPLVVFYGLAGCFKTTLAHVAERALNAVYLAPSQFGVAHDSDGNPLPCPRLRRYAHAFRLMERFLPSPAALVFDGCLDFPATQSRMVAWARAEPRRSWVFVRCGTTNPELTVRRIEARRHDPGAGDARACTDASLRCTERGFNGFIAAQTRGLPWVANVDFDSATDRLSPYAGSALTSVAAEFVHLLLCEAVHGRASG